jgi:NADH:ubiquinone oxidoreductase subunit 2 (subunit N)
MMSYLVELLLTNVIEVFLTFYVLTMISAAVIINTLRLLDYPVLLPAVSGISILALFMALVICLNDSVSQTAFCYAFSGTASLDVATFNVKLFCLCLTLVILIANRDYLKQVTLDGFESNQLLILSVIGMIIMAASNDLISIYLAIELQSLCFYAIIGMNSQSEISIEASLKYFVFGALASCILLFGFALIYSAFGTTQLNNLFLLSYSTITVEHNGLGLLFVFVAFLIKLGVAPFHV